MRLFIKTKKHNQYYTGKIPEIKLPNNKEYSLGIDASTSSFGFAIRSTDNKFIMIGQIMRHHDQKGAELRNEAIDFIAGLLWDHKIKCATYEKTPDDFKQTDIAFQVMKETEREVENLIRNRLSVNPKYIFAILPNSWKHKFVEEDLINNKNKINKRRNAISILNKVQVPILKNQQEEILKSLSEIPKHDYDCIEALAIEQYGSTYIIFNEEGDRLVYKDYTKKTVGSVLVGIIDNNLLESKLNQLHSIFNTTDINVFYNNDDKCLLENLNSLRVNYNIIILDYNNDNSKVVSYLTNQTLKVDQSVIFIYLKSVDTEKNKRTAELLTNITESDFKVIKI